MVRRIRKKQHKRRKKHQRGGFLNQYGFAYAGRDMINQAMEGLDALASKIIKQAKGQLDQIAPWHIQQVKNQGGQQVEKIAPKVIKGGIEEVYKTPFRLLGRFGTKNSCIVLVEKLERFKRLKKSTKNSWRSSFLVISGWKFTTNWTPSQKFIKNFVSFLRTPISRNTSKWLLLEINFPPTMMSCRASWIRLEQLNLCGRLLWKTQYERHYWKAFKIRLNL